MENEIKFYDHKGYKMRSFTERAWARLMDALGVLYTYEPDLIQVEGCKYLPDFYLPECGAYLEVKGTAPTDEEIAKAEQATKTTGRPVAFLVARPQADGHGFCNCHLLVPIRGKYIHLSLHELDQAYLSVAGEREWYRALVSVRNGQDIPGAMIGHLMEEMLLKMGDRNRMEAMLRQRNKELNAARMAEPHKVSIAEQGIKWWVENRA